MDTIAVILGLFGLAAGFFIPLASRRIIDYKCSQKSRAVKAPYMDQRAFRIVVMVFNSIAWSVAGLGMDNPLAATLVSLIVSMGLLFAIIDIRIHIIPNQLIAAALPLGILFQWIQFGWKGLLISIATMFAMMLIFLLVGVIVGMEKVGAGDVKLVAVMGLILGFPLILMALLIMAGAMILYIGFGLLTRRMTYGSMFPFAPFMMLGMIGALAYFLWTGQAQFLY